MNLHRTPDRVAEMERAFGTAVAIGFTTWLVAAWTYAWLVLRPLDEHVTLMAVLRSLEWRRSPLEANALTAMLFVASHLPGWVFQGRLLEVFSRPIGGAAAIFAIGCALGFIAQGSRSVGASIVAHALNNLCS